MSEKKILGLALLWSQCNELKNSRNLTTCPGHEELEAILFISIFRKRADSSSDFA